MSRQNAESFDAAFDSLFHLAYAVGYRILGIREDAEDVALETLARASIRWERIRARPEA